MAGWREGRERVETSGLVMIEEPARILGEVTAPTVGKRTQKALGALQAEHDRAGDWARRVRVLQDELAALKRHTGDVLVEDPDQAPRLSLERARLREEIVSAEAAVTAMQARVTGAVVACFQAEADELRDELDEVGKRRDRHTARTAKLLAELLAHDGTYVPALPPHEHAVYLDGPPPVFVPSRGREMKREANELQVRIELLLCAVRAGAAPRSVPGFAGWRPVPGRLYSPRLHGPGALLPELVSGLHLSPGTAAYAAAEDLISSEGP